MLQTFMTRNNVLTAKKTFGGSAIKIMDLCGRGEGIRASYEGPRGQALPFGTLPEMPPAREAINTRHPKE